MTMWQCLIQNHQLRWLLVSTEPPPLLCPCALPILIPRTCIYQLVELVSLKNKVMYSLLLLSQVFRNDECRHEQKLWTVWSGLSYRLVEMFSEMEYLKNKHRLSFLFHLTWTIHNDNIIKISHDFHAQHTGTRLINQGKFHWDKF